MLAIVCQPPMCSEDKVHDKVMMVYFNTAQVLIIQTYFEREGTPRPLA